MKCHHEGKAFISQHQAGYMCRLLHSIKYRGQGQSCENLSDKPSSNQTLAFKSDGENVDRKVRFYFIFLQIEFSVKKLVKCT